METWESIAIQSLLPSEVIFVDDGGAELEEYIQDNLRHIDGVNVLVEHNACNLGVVASLNIGVAISKHALVLLGCTDDLFLPNCVQRCADAWEEYQNPLAYYYLGVKYSDGREQNCACGAAMVTKELWRYTGGFPPQAAVGAADHIFLSCLMAGARDGYSKAQIIRVSDELTYWYRVHGKTETSTTNIWPAIEAVRDRLTAEWRPR